MKDRLASIQADPFWGNGEIELPKPQGLAATWMFLKAQTGNTHPGATVPFGMVSACAHSGAYPTGYYLNLPNYNGSVPKLYERNCADGFAHFHHSGTGAVGIYYNYFRTTPLPDVRLEHRNLKRLILEERAEPGFYSASLEGSGVRAELVAGARGVVHRYRFPGGVRPALAIDVSNGGLDIDRHRSFATAIEMRVLGDSSAEASALMEGARIFVHARIEGRPGVKASLFEGERTLQDSFMKLSAPELSPGRQFGLLFEAGEQGGELCLTLGFSLKSFEQAKANCQALGSFDSVRASAAAQWKSCLGKIELDADGRTASIFKSALYHSFVKPADCSDESPFGDSGDFYLDFSTMWDMYKTQIPLVATLFPERMAGIANSFVKHCERVGRLPNALLMAGFEKSKEDAAAGHDMQARALPCHSILDAWHRGVQGVDWSRALKAMAADVFSSSNDDFLKGGLAKPLTHTLDLAVAADCVRQLAEGLGDSELAALASRHAASWRNVYDKSTGLLLEGEYYEGTLWNYSFRLLPDMEGRVGLCGKERFVALLDKFFGFGAEPVVQMASRDDEYHKYAYSLHRFEGLNNEPDMETPFAYLFAGRHDRAAEIVRAGMRYMFSTGRGGAPGNVDSGALSSWYVWNALGLFPVAGQDLLLIGSPAAGSSAIYLPGGDLSIKVEGNSEDSVYVGSAFWNGKPLKGPFLAASETLKGGELKLEMSSKPSGFGS